MSRLVKIIPTIIGGWKLTFALEDNNGGSSIFRKICRSENVVVIATSPRERHDTNTDFVSPISIAPRVSPSMEYGAAVKRIVLERVGII
jgi:hypothetical protein